MQKNIKKIAVLVSGGVDSSLSLALLKEQGHDVTAFYLKIWLEDELSYLGSCPWQDDLKFVQSVCDKLEVPLRIISMQQQYHDKVVSYLLSEVKAGRTPNPDVFCNVHIKFGAFYEAIDSSGELFDSIATGHYARIQHSDFPFVPSVLRSKTYRGTEEFDPSIQIFFENSLRANGKELKIDKDEFVSSRNYAQLLKGLDPVKDQTYFLSCLTQDQLARALFPIGHLHKSQVRELAQKYELLNHDRKDSQGICFLGKFNFADFLQAHLGIRKGDLIEFETGQKMGTHDGFWFFTIGQRQGIGLSGGPWYVVKKDVQKNIIFISKNYDAVAEHKSGMIVRNFNWNQVYPREALAETEDPGILLLDARFRHGPALHAAQVEIIGSGVKITLKTESKQGIAVGQIAALYEGDVCLGGGVIDEAF